MHRYEIGRGAGDGLTGREGTFNMCTFWLVEALTRAGRVEEARFIFEKMLTYANHLGLYAEETGPSGEALVALENLAGKGAPPAELKSLPAHR